MTLILGQRAEQNRYGGREKGRRAPRWRAVFKMGTNKRDVKPDDSRGGGMGMKVPEDETQLQDAAGFATN